MALLCPDEGEVQLLTDLLGGGTLEAMTLKLGKTNITPAETDTAASYTVADFAGYSSKTLTRTVGASTWNTPATSGGVTSSSYGSSPQSWSATSPQAVFMYWIQGATSAKVLWAENFGSISLTNPSTLTMTPKIQLD